MRPQTQWPVQGKQREPTQITQVLKYGLTLDSRLLFLEMSEIPVLMRRWHMQIQYLFYITVLQLDRLAY